MTMQCGPIRHTVKPAEESSAKGISLRVIRRDTGFDASTLPANATIHEVFSAIAMDEARTGSIAEHVCELIGEGRSPLVLTERRRNLDDLVGELTERVPGLFVFHGGMSAAPSRKEVDRLNELPSSEPCLVLATGRYIGEGFDAPRLDTLLLAMPIAWKGTLTQYAGRLHRAHAGKREVRVYDYVDAEVPVLRRMYAKRMSAYRSLGYELSPQAALL